MSKRIVVVFFLLSCLTILSGNLFGASKIRELSRKDCSRRYFFLNETCTKYNYEAINSCFGPQSKSHLAVGNAILVYMFALPMEQYETILKKHFQEAEKYDIPVLLELDPLTFLNDVPEIWNWWNPELPGYDPNNRENVEWTGWDSESAVKIGWLNWGRQIRLAPMPNLFSEEYQEAVRSRMSQFLSWTEDWYKSLPKRKKYLLGGIKLTGELAFGVNNWYYPNGNDYFDLPSADDPKTGIRTNEMPSRGVSQIGYASLKSSGIRSSGQITAEDIFTLERRFAAFVADLAKDYSFPRELLYSHSGGEGEDLAAAIQESTCPSWSFYWAEAENPAETEKVTKYLKDSDAQYWACSEWNIGDKTGEVWLESLRNTFSIPGCRFVSLFNTDTVLKIEENGTVLENTEAINALKSLSEEL